MLHIQNMSRKLHQLLSIVTETSGLAV